MVPTKVNERSPKSLAKHIREVVYGKEEQTANVDKVPPQSD